MLNKIILFLLQKQQSSTSSVDAMQSDDFENPKTYKSYIYPLRYILAMRYLKIKQRVIKRFKEQKIYPIPKQDFHQALLLELSANKTNKLIQADQTSKLPFYTGILKSGLVYPVLLAALVFGGIKINGWQQQKKIENVLANHLPYYSDLLHRRLVLKHNDKSDMLKQVEEAIAKEHEKILSDLPNNKEVKNIIDRQLKNLADENVDSEAVMLGFKDVNTLFDGKNIPYYLSPKSYTMPCSSLIDAPVEQMMMLKQLESLMSNNNPELCRTTMLTTYKVDERRQLFYDDKNKTKELPLFLVNRIDKVPAVDSALGLTFKDRGIGSIILLDQIKDFARESILPALTFQGRSYIIPYWMQGYYEIEEAVTKGYKKDIDIIYSDSAEKRIVKNVVKKLINDKSHMQNSKMKQTMQRTNNNSPTNIFGQGMDAISVLMGKENENNEKKKAHTLKKEEIRSLRKLDDILLPSIEYHEAYHQIDKKGWKKLPWLSNTFPKDMNENAIDHTLEELGAYLSQLATTEKGHNIWLSKLLIFSLNPMTKGQAEYYSSGIIFTTMEALYLGKPVDPRYKASVEEKTRIYKTLITKDYDEIRFLARKAFEVLFERPVPDLRL